jgi:hypothetical protein
MKYENGEYIIYDMAGRELWRGRSLANLSGANLNWANLNWADLSRADLTGANLSWADLSGADLSGADVTGADLHGADLRGADLSGANLSRADLSGADLTGTSLDPALTPNADAGEFGHADMDGWVYGYRTRATSAAGRQLQDGRIYAAEVFSTADTECHPGWYLWPTLQQCRNFRRVASYVRVRARICDIHKAGNKWRARAIWVIGAAE